MMPIISTRPPRARRRLLAQAVVAALLVGGGVWVASPAVAAPAPVIVDDFDGTVLGTRTVTTLPLPNTSTTAPGTFTQSGGSGTMTMGGYGNAAGGVQLAYSMPSTDLTSGGSNTQFMLDFASIQRTGTTPLDPTAAIISISVTGGGITGTYSTGVGNTGPFNVVLNFSCASGPCFSPQPDFTHVTAIQVTVMYPRNHEATANTTTAVLNSIHTTPTGGAVPSPATPTVTGPATPAYALSGATLSYHVHFASDGTSAPVYSLSSSGVSVTGTAGGIAGYTLAGSGADYTVTVGPLTSSGSVSVALEAGAAIDAWGQPTNAGNTETTQFVLSVAPHFGAQSDILATRGTAFSHQFDAGGVPTPTYALASGTLPAGVTLSTAGVLSGTPTVSGEFTITVQATNVVGSDAVQTKIVVADPPAFTSAATAVFVKDVNGSFAVTTTGMTNATLTATGLPAGLSFTDNHDGTGTISGTPTVSGTTSATLTGQAGAITATQTLTVTVREIPSFLPGTPPSGEVGQPYGYAFTTAGLPAPTFAVTSGALPPGVTIDSTSGALSGTPTVAGLYHATITATNLAGGASQDVDIRIDESPAFTSATTFSFTLGTAGSAVVTTSGSPIPTIALTSGTLPAGLSFVDMLNGTATVSGTPTESGVFSITLTATGHGTAAQNVTVVVVEAPTFVSETPPQFVVGTPASFTVHTRGWPRPALTIDAGSLPAGLTFADNGDGTASIAGTPTAADDTTLTLSATSSSGTTSRTLHLSVAQSPAFTSAAKAAFLVGTAGTFTVSATGTPSPVLTVDAGTLPTGLTFTDNGDGTATIAGTPIAGTKGITVLAVRATVAGSLTADQQLSLHVNQAPVFTSSPTATFTAGTHGTFTVTTDAFPVATLALDGTLPPGLAFTDNGDGTATIEGTPSASSIGTYTVTVNATNDVVDPPQQISIVVAPATATPTPSPSPSTPASSSAQTSDGSGLATTGGAIPWAVLWMGAFLIAIGALLTVRREIRRRS